MLIPCILLHKWHGNVCIVQLILDLTDVSIKVLRDIHAIY